jgi:hypothetical protein
MGSGLQTFREGVRRNSRVRVLLVLLLAAFVFQTAVLRAHIHAGSAQSVAHELTAEACGGGTPSPVHNEKDCPLWHASSISGTGLIAVATTAIAPLSSTSRASLDERTTAPERFAAAWRSRAPPVL